MKEIPLEQFLNQLPEALLQGVNSSDIATSRVASIALLDIYKKRGMDALGLPGVVGTLSRNQHPLAALSLAEVLLKNGIANHDTVLIELQQSIRDVATVYDNPGFVKLVSHKVDLVIQQVPEDTLQGYPAQSILAERCLMEGDIDGAIECLEVAASNGSIDAYFEIARLYAMEGEYSEACGYCEEAYDALVHYQGVYEGLFLERAMEYAYAAKDYERAGILHAKFKLLKHPEIAPSYLVYKGFVSNDEELEELSSILLRYEVELQKTPPSVVLNLVTQAKRYISSRIVAEQGLLTLEAFLAQDISKMSEQQKLDYQVAFQRVLFLMQVSVLVFRDTEYIETYVSLLRGYGLHGTYEQRNLISDFFLEHYSPLVLYHMKKQSEKKEGTEDELTDDDIALVTSDDTSIDTAMEDKESIYTQNEIELATYSADAIFNHLEYIYQHFLYGLNYPVFEKVLVPAMDDAIHISKKLAENDIINLQESMLNSRRTYQVIMGLSPDSQATYRNLHANIDQIIGPYISHQLQVALESMVGGDYTPILQKDTSTTRHPTYDIYVFVECLMRDGVDIGDSDDLLRYMDSHHIVDVPIDIYYMIAELLYINVGIDIAFVYLIQRIELFFEDKTILRILAWLGRSELDPLSDEVAILNRFVRDSTEYTSFYRYVLSRIYELQKTSDQTGLTEEYIRLAGGYFDGIVGIDRSTIVQDMDESKDHEFLVSLGDKLQHDGKYMEAHDCYVRRYSYTESYIDLVRIINNLLRGGDIVRAQSYMVFASTQGFDILEMLLYIALVRESTEESLNLMSRITSGESFGQGSISVPGTMEMYDALRLRLIDEGTPDEFMMVYHIKALNDERSDNLFSKLSALGGYIACLETILQDKEYSIEYLQKTLSKAIVHICGVEHQVPREELSLSELFALDVAGMYLWVIKKLENILDEYTKKGTANADTISFINEYIVSILQELLLRLSKYEHLIDPERMKILRNTVYNTYPHTPPKKTTFINIPVGLLH